VVEREVDVKVRVGGRLRKHVLAEFIDFVLGDALAE
jgi:hypothetical protein